ncbi:MAG: phosphodiester glycosidase family protein [Chloroflexi bacterium]|nr:phosphodiester glycosidase family protein [Chloroflexota bacterium]
MLFVILAAFLVAIGGYTLVNAYPGTAAQAADVLRGLFGDQPVALLETTTYQIQDTLLRLRYSLMGSKASAPWSGGSVQAAARPETSTPSLRLTALPTSTDPMPSAAPVGEGTVTPSPAPEPTASPVPTQAPWVPASLIPLGNLEGEGQWSPYIQDASGRTVAYRAFLQPDPLRDYAVVAVIAFDLQTTRLNYVLGTEEPISDARITRTGEIPKDQVKPGILLAIFNGGFKTRHGKFGVAVNSTTLVPLKDGLGTLAIYRDGQVRLGAWGTGLTASPDQIVLRQNGPLVVQHGVVNPLVMEAAPEIWGYTIKETAPIWRSGVGLSADGRTLYYFAGPSLTLPAFAHAIAGSGASDAIQLDINNYWVHFDAIQFEGGKPTTLPLFDYMGRDNPNRYLYAYPKDYFYITAAGR